MPATATRNGLLSAAHVAPPLMEMSMAPDEASFLHNEEPALTVTTTLSKTRVWGFGLSSRTLSALGRPVSTGATRACVSGSGRQASGSGEFRIFDPNGAALSTSAYGWTRLFQGREYIPMLDAYDFRARTLWPELGRFGQEDPAGTVDSTNRYQALGGRWNGVTDPTGKYEEDVHHYLTWFLARAVGFDEGTASELGRQTGKLDYDERSAMRGGAGNPNLEDFHFVSPGRANELFRASTPQRNLDVAAAGAFLHAFQDTYSHQKNFNHRDWNDQYNKVIGHGADGHRPDWTWDRPGLAMEMAEATYQKLLELRRRSKFISGVEASRTFSGVTGFAEVEGKVRRFVEFQNLCFYTQTYPEYKFTFQNVFDYTPKIKELDSNFELTTYERFQRNEEYRSFLESKEAAFTVGCR